MNEKKNVKVEEMFEEDTELFEEEFEDEEFEELKGKAFKFGQKLGQITSSKAYKIGKKVLKAGAVVAAGYVVYKKGFEAGESSAIVNALDNNLSDESESETEDFEEMVGLTEEK